MSKCPFNENIKCHECALFIPAANHMPFNPSGECSYKSIAKELHQLNGKISNYEIRKYI